MHDVTVIVFRIKKTGLSLLAPLMAKRQHPSQRKEKALNMLVHGSSRTNQSGIDDGIGVLDYVDDFPRHGRSVAARK